MPYIISIAGIILFSYLLGSFNGGLLLSKLVKHEDIREKGSGNAGFTNIKRVYGAKSAAIVCVIDILKTVLACVAGGLIVKYVCHYDNYTAGILLAGFFVQIGHVFPCFFKFKGGKGFICGMATILVADWRIFLIALAVLFIVTLISKYVSLGSLCATFTYAVLFTVFYFNAPLVYAVAWALAILVFISHRKNIVRLVKGNENKTYFFGKKEK